MTSIWTSYEHTLSEKAVFESLSESPAKNNYEIALRIGVSERTVRNALDVLKEQGLVTVGDEIKRTKKEV